MSRQRDLYLDFYRGIAAVSVVFIHTVTWSGAEYLPNWLRSFSLWIDVPLFIFCSGWSANYSCGVDKAVHNILVSWLKYIVFITGLNIVNDWIVGEQVLTFRNWIPQWFINYLEGTLSQFTLFTANIWFFPMWISVTFGGSIIVAILKRFDGDNRLAKQMLAVFFIGVIWFTTGTISTFYFFSRNFTFYIIFYILGYIHKDYKIKHVLHWLVICACLICLCWLSASIYEIRFDDLPSAKFPPTTTYLFFSLISITTAVFLKGRIDKLVKKGRLIRFIGENALWFYFAQNISAQCLYYLIPFYSDLNAFLKLILSFSLNFSIAGILAFICICLDKSIQKIIQTIRLRYNASSPL